MGMLTFAHGTGRAPNKHHCIYGREYLVETAPADRYNRPVLRQRNPGAFGKNMAPRIYVAAPLASSIQWNVQATARRVLLCGVLSVYCMKLDHNRDLFLANHHQRFGPTYEE